VGLRHFSDSASVPKGMFPWADWSMYQKIRMC
jgi:hypothetical protein